MNELKEKVIAAMIKQVELLNHDGGGNAIDDYAIRKIEALTALLDLLVKD